MNPMYLNPSLTGFASGDLNDNSAYIPEVWANESLAILLENMVIANLVHRDFENEVRNYGDVVNTRRPGEFVAKRKTDVDEITIQDAIATNVQVPLDQHFHTSFIIKDGEWSKSFKDLVTEYVAPAMQSLARAVDQVCLGQVHRYLANSAGKLGGLDSSNAASYILDLREIMNVNKAYVNGRRLIVSPSSETQFLKNDQFTSADKVGDNGTALREASLGRKLGFDIFMSQNVNYITDNNTEYASGTVTSAVPAGTTGSQTVTLTGYNAVVGEFVSITGDQQPQIVSARTLSMADTTAITLVDALKFAIGATAPFKIYKAADVDGTKAAGYAKEISIDGFAANKGPQVGQLLAFGTGVTRHTYTVIATEVVTSTNTKVWLDRPLSAGITDGDPAFPGPSGSLNLGFHRNALALVNRPLALPMQDTGVRAAVVNDQGVAMRATMQYNSIKQGTVVTLDMLCGVAVLDTNLGAVLLG